MLSTFKFQLKAAQKSLFLKKEGKKGSQTLAFQDHWDFITVS